MFSIIVFNPPIFSPEAVDFFFYRLFIDDAFFDELGDAAHGIFD
jgi:hypothetical protein